MAKSTTYLRDQLANAVLIGNTYAPGQLYVGLFTTLPTLEDASDGVEFDSNAAQSTYARQDIKAAWTSNSSALPIIEYKNNTKINFESGASGWDGVGGTSTVSGVGIWDASSGGNCLMFAAIDANRTIGPNQDLDINIDGLVVNFTSI